MTRRASVTLMALVSVGILYAQDAQYMGADKCAKMCHKAPKKGNQYGQWQESKHAKAYATLATDAAKEVAKKAGVEGDPQQSDKCLPCHVTGHGADKKLLSATYKVEDGVGCESCHGAGSNYAKLNIMKDKAASTKAGMVDPTQEVCVKCHNEMSPTYKEFVFEEMVKEIAHPNPEAAATK